MLLRKYFLLKQKIKKYDFFLPFVNWCLLHSSTKACTNCPFWVETRYFSDAMERWRKTLGDQHPFIAIAYSNMGSVCLDQKDYACAEKNYREAVRRLDASSKDSVNATIAHLKLGRALLREGRFKEAEGETRPAYEYLVKHVPADNGFLAASRKDLTAIYEGMHSRENAARFQLELDVAAKH